MTIVLYLADGRRGRRAGKSPSQVPEPLSTSAVRRFGLRAPLGVAGGRHGSGDRDPPGPAAIPGSPDRRRSTRSAEEVRRSPLGGASAGGVDRLSGRALFLVVLAGRGGSQTAGRTHLLQHATEQAVSRRHSSRCRTDRSEPGAVHHSHSRPARGNSSTSEEKLKEVNANLCRTITLQNL